MWCPRRPSRALATKHGYHIGLRAVPHVLVRLFKSAAGAFWGPAKNVLAGLHGRTWLAPLVLLWPLLVFWTPVVAIVVGAWESPPAVRVAGFAAMSPFARRSGPAEVCFGFCPVNTDSLVFQRERRYFALQANMR